MADINSKPTRQESRATAAATASGSPGRSPRGRPAKSSSAARSSPVEREQVDAKTDGLPNELVKFVELLFFAYRDFTGDADELLADLGYGRAHHRVIHFVARHPGLRVADLLNILRITKQSLARVLKQLIDEGYIEQCPGETDRRERHLYLTDKGLNFAENLTEHQCARVGKALDTIGFAGRQDIEKFLVAMISDTEQAAVLTLLDQASPATGTARSQRIKGTKRGDDSAMGDNVD